MSDSRLEDLVGRLLDDELTPDGWCELLLLVRDESALLRELRDQLEASELLALSEDVLRRSPLFLETIRSRLGDDVKRPGSQTPATNFLETTRFRLPEAGFVAGVRAAIAGGSTGRRSAHWPWAVAAAAAPVVLTAVALWPWGRTEVARVTGLNGSLQWIGDGVRVQRDLKVGTVLNGGTLEAMSADSWVSLEFLDGSAITVSGPTMLTLSEGDQKELLLREANLFAKVARQAKGRPLLIHIRTAELEVLGTQLDVEAEPRRSARSSTRSIRRPTS